MAGGDLLVDRLVAGGFLRPAVLLRGLQLRRPALSCWRVGLVMGLSGLLVEPLAWLQSWLWARRLRKAELPDDPIVVVCHWRCGTTYLHQLLACHPTLATAPQVALLLKPWIRWDLRARMTRQRPIDAVPWGPDDPQEDELGLARLTIDTNMAGMAYPWFFWRNVLGSSAAFERHWLHFTKLTWIYDGQRKTGLLI